MKTVKGWPTGPAVVVGSLMGFIAMATTVFNGTVAMWAVIAIALAALIAYGWSLGQFRLDGEAHWDQGAFVGAATFVFLAGASLVNWYTDPLIAGPVFAVIMAGIWAWGLKRWGVYAVHEDELV